MSEKKRLNDKYLSYVLKRIFMILAKITMVIIGVCLLVLIARFIVGPLFNKLVFLSSDPLSPHATSNLIKLAFVSICIYCFFLRKWLCKPF